MINSFQIRDGFERYKPEITKIIFKKRISRTCYKEEVASSRTYHKEEVASSRTYHKVEVASSRTCHKEEVASY